MAFHNPAGGYSDTARYAKELNNLSLVQKLKDWNEEGLKKEKEQDAIKKTRREVVQAKGQVSPNEMTATLDKYYRNNGEKREDKNESVNMPKKKIPTSYIISAFGILILASIGYISRPIYNTRSTYYDLNAPQPNILLQSSPLLLIILLCVATYKWGIWFALSILGILIGIIATAADSILGAFIGVVILDVGIIRYISKKEPSRVSCHKCSNLAYRGKFATWQIVLSVVLFPLGLLSLLAGRGTNECPHCGYIWN